MLLQNEHECVSDQVPAALRHFGLDFVVRFQINVQSLHEPTNTQTALNGAATVKSHTGSHAAVKPLPDSDASHSSLANGRRKSGRDEA